MRAIRCCKSGEIEEADKTPKEVETFEIN